MEAGQRKPRDESLLIALADPDPSEAASIAMRIVNSELNTSMSVMYDK